MMLFFKKVVSSLSVNFLFAKKSEIFHEYFLKKNVFIVLRSIFHIIEGGKYASGNRPSCFIFNSEAPQSHRFAVFGV